MLSLAQAYDGLVASDEIVAKTAKISEVAQIARAEKRMREYLDAAWEKRAKKATALAAKMAAQGKTAKQITAAVDGFMNTWAGEIKPVFLKEVERIYRLARTAGHKKANRQTTKPLVYNMPKFEKVEKAAKGTKVVAQLLPSFDLVDEHAVAALQNHQVFWMGDLYKNGVSPEIAKITRQTMIEAGGDPSKAAALMKERMKTTLSQVKVPAGFTGTTKQYFEGVAANAATVARVHGQMRSFMSIGITRYTISNPADQRTCLRCSHMDGKVFTTQQGAEQMQNELSATTPDAVKAAHPWPTEKQMKSISPKPGNQGPSDSKALAASGLSLPPYHFRCRCTVDVDASTGSYDNLAPMTVAAAPNPLRMASAASWANSLSPAERKAFEHWTSGGYNRVRQLQAGMVAEQDMALPAVVRAQKTLAEMEKALASSPHYEGVIHRGMVIRPEEAAVFKKGAIIKQDAMASWSKDKEIAKLFALDSGPEQRYVVMKYSAKRGAHDITMLSTEASEKEVIVSKGKRLIVKDVKKVSRTVGGTKRYGIEVTLAEADDATLPVLKPAPKLEPKPLSPSKQAVADMEAGKVVSSSRIGSGVNSAEWVELETADGKKVRTIFKAASKEKKNLRVSMKNYHNNEVAAFKLDQMLGGEKVVPPTIKREVRRKGIGSMQYVEKDVKHAGTFVDYAENKIMPEYVAATEKFSTDPHIRKTFLLDVISANDDRHQANLMFKVIKKGGETKYQAVAIDNGLSFPINRPPRFIMPTQGMPGATVEMRANIGNVEKALLTLDEASVAQVNALKLDEVARMLHLEGIQPEAIKSTLVRIKALQNDSAVMTKMPGIDPEVLAKRFLKASIKEPTKLISAEELAGIDKIVATAAK